MQRPMLRELMREKSACFRRAYRYLEAAAPFYADAADVWSGVTDAGVVERLFTPLAGYPGRASQSRRFGPGAAAVCGSDYAKGRGILSEYPCFAAALAHQRRLGKRRPRTAAAPARYSPSPWAECGKPHGSLLGRTYPPPDRARAGSFHYYGRRHSPIAKPGRAKHRFARRATGCGTFSAANDARAGRLIT